METAWLRWIDLDSCPAVNALERLLGPGEQVRAARFGSASRRREFIGARAATRILLGDITGRRPDKIRLAYHPEGKPFLLDQPTQPLDFSLSHSGGAALLGVCLGGRIGVDLERYRLMNQLEIPRRWFTPEEAAWLESLHWLERSRRFLECWTRKEAYLKALGTGLSGGVRTCRCQAGADQTVVAEVAQDPQGRWRLLPLDTPRFAACAAIDFEPRRVDVRDFEWPARGEARGVDARASGDESTEAQPWYLFSV